MCRHAARGKEFHDWIFLRPAPPLPVFLIKLGNDREIFAVFFSHDGPRAGAIPHKRIML